MGFASVADTFYSLLMVGSYPHGDLGRWSSGFGIGGHIPLGRQLFLNVDFITRQVGYTDEWAEETWWYDEHTVLNQTAPCVWLGAAQMVQRLRWRFAQLPRLG